MTTTNSQRLRQQLETSKRKVLDGFDGLPVKFIIDFARVLDYTFTAANMPGVVSSKERDEWFSYFKYAAEGWASALTAFLDGYDLEPTLIKPSSEIDKAKALDALIQLGKIGITNRYAHLSIYENFKCDTDDKNFTITSKQPDSSIEYIEVLSQNWLRDYLRQQQDNSYRHQLLPLVKRSLSTNVCLSEKGTIHYESDNHILKYFLIEAKNFSETSLGYDYYSDDAYFGRLTFATYKKVVVSLIALAEQHQAFCLTLYEKSNRNLDLANHLTQICPTDILIKQVSRSSGLEETQVNEALKAITLTSELLKCINLPSGYASPLLIQISPTHILLSLLAHMTNPFMYLHRCLRNLFPKQYAVATKNREERFKQDFYEWFKSPIQTVSRNMVIGSKAQPKTDIDAVLYHEREQILILVQLKWMEDWATDMRLRRNMKKEFQKKIDQWITKVDDFITTSDLRDLNQRLGLKHISNRTTIYKLILGKHFSLFGGYPSFMGTYYLNWATFVQIMVSAPQCCNSLKLFISELDKSSLSARAAGIQKQLVDNPQEFIIDDYTVTIRFQS